MVVSAGTGMETRNPGPNDGAAKNESGMASNHKNSARNNTPPAKRPIHITRMIRDAVRVMKPAARSDSPTTFSSIASGAW
jgi:hypothetical protein